MFHIPFFCFFMLELYFRISLHLKKVAHVPEILSRGIYSSPHAFAGDLFLQRYAFLLKKARNYWKMFEGEGDKKKKVYPRLPDIWGKKDTPYSFYSPLISCSVKPVIKAICSILNPLASILRAMLFFSSTRPSARPSALPSSIPSNLAFPKTSF